MSAATLLSIPVLVSIVFVWGVIRGKVRLGSALFGAACGVVVGGIALRRFVYDWASTGLGWVATNLRDVLTGVQLHGFAPAAAVPLWGWQVVSVILLAVVLLGVVAALDGRAGSKK